MRALAIAVIVSLATACGGASPPAPASTVTSSAGSTKISAGPGRYEQTSFGVIITGHGRPVIYIPGLGCPGSVWNDTADHLTSTESYQLTLAGFAGRPAIAEPRLADKVIRELALYIRDRKLDHPVIIGHSMGGMIAYGLAATAPDLVGPVIVVDAMPAIGTDPGSAAMGAAMRTKWLKMTDAQFASAVREFFAPMATDPHRIDKLIDDVARSDHRAIADAFHELFTIDLRPEVGKITTPVLVVLADGPFQQQMKEQISAIPHAEVIVLPHTRHFVMWDDPAGFNAAIDKFLAAHP